MIIWISDFFRNAVAFGPKWPDMTRTGFIKAIFAAACLHAPCQVSSISFLTNSVSPDVSSYKQNHLAFPNLLSNRDFFELPVEVITVFILGLLTN
jgi:hypothetical protein